MREAGKIYPYMTIAAWKAALQIVQKAAAYSRWSSLSKEKQREVKNLKLSIRDTLKT